MGIRNWGMRQSIRRNDIVFRFPFSGNIAKCGLIISLKYPIICGIVEPMCDHWKCASLGTI